MQTEKGRQRLCRDFLRAYCGGLKLDAIRATIKMRKTWGIRVDWHEMSEALEYLVESSAEAERVGMTSERMALYLVA